MLINRSMTRRVITINEASGILAAREKMLEFKIGALPVLSEDQALVGIVTDRDLRSALPSGLLPPGEIQRQKEALEGRMVKDIMTRDPVTVSPFNTLQDALVLILKTHVSTLPVVDKEKRVVGIISIRDLLRAFSEVLGIDEPGTLLCVLAEDRQGEMKRIVDAITEERIRFGSVLVARHFEKGKKAYFPYLFTNNVARIKHKLESLGLTLPNPMEWYLTQQKKGFED
jgi:acetoin utilization protein AcuB